MTVKYKEGIQETSSHQIKALKPLNEFTKLAQFSLSNFALILFETVDAFSTGVKRSNRKLYMYTRIGH